jgi:hypothetical protein
MNVDPDLIPPDFERCQCEQRSGSFMTLGPRKMVRCESTPVWLAVEIIAGKDGRHGAMTLCQPCAEVMLENADLRVRVQLQPLLREPVTEVEEVQ